jgi:hypothetical protein
MSALIDPEEDPVERCSALCSEVSFLLKNDFFAVELTTLHDYDQIEDIPFKTTVGHENQYFFCLLFCHVLCSPCVDVAVMLLFQANLKKNSCGFFSGWTRT